MILPTRRFLLLLALPVAWLLVFTGPWAIAAAVAYDLALLALAAVDLLASVRPRQVHVERLLPRRLSLGEANPVGWRVRHEGEHPLTVWLTDDLPPELRVEPAVLTAVLRPRSTAELLVHVTPTARGRYELGDTHLRYRTRLGLLRRQARLPRRDEVKVYPNVRNLARYELAARRNRLRALGLTAVKQRGRGRIFESLRDYVRGDSTTDIAWKASARRQRLTVRNFEDDRSQSIVLVLDCGRLMTTLVDDLSRLDHAINACLLLTYVAVKQGDYIGLVAFHDTVTAYVPPVKGRAAVGRMNEALYNLQPKLCEPNYEAACRFLGTRHRKRSLIIFLTDVIDAEASWALVSYSARFARQHLPLCFTLRNAELEAVARGPGEAGQGVFSQAIALQMLERRAAALQQMRQGGVDVMDVHARELTPRLIDRYLSVKHRHRL